jgi:hypothetical protein
VSSINLQWSSWYVEIAALVLGPSRRSFQNTRQELAALAIMLTRDPNMFARDGELPAGAYLIEMKISSSIKYGL